MKKTKLLFCILSLVLMNSAHSAIGHEGGGGDAKVIRSQVLSYKREHLKQEVIGAFQDNNPNYNAVTTVRRLLSWIAAGKLELKNQKAQAILTDMLTKGFGKDLSKTNFVMSSSCVDRFKIERSAVASMNVPQSDICINPERLVEEFGPYIQDSDIMALMMHEFSHHYGHEDTDHSFAAAIALEYQRDNEERSQEGLPLNNLIK